MTRPFWIVLICLALPLVIIMAVLTELLDWSERAFVMGGWGILIVTLLFAIWLDERNKRAKHAER